MTTIKENAYALQSWDYIQTDIDICICGIYTHPNIAAADVTITKRISCKYFIVKSVEPFELYRVENQS